MKTALAIVGAIYLAAWALATLGYADMRVCFAWQGSCNAPAPTSLRPWKPL